MNNKVNYTAVGFIVLFGIISIFGFAYWLIKPTDNQEMKKYVIYFNESVLGLNVDAPVKYRGISVGKVLKLSINPKNSEQVRVLIAISKDTPIKESTVAQLTAQGITGLTYINLFMGDHNGKELKAKHGEEYPVIQSIPSFMQGLEDSFGSVSSKLSSTLVKTSELLRAENQRNFSELLKNSADMMAKANKLLDDKTIQHLQSTAMHLDNATKALEAMMPQIQSFLKNSKDWEKSIKISFDSIADSFVGIKDSMKGIKDATRDGVNHLNDSTTKLTPALQSTLLDTQNLLIEMQSVLDQYKRSPSDMLLRKEKIQMGPGEER